MYLQPEKCNKNNEILLYTNLGLKKLQNCKMSTDDGEWVWVASLMPCQQS